MSEMTRRTRLPGILPRIVALVMVALLGWMARIPSISDVERASLASRFRFTHFTLSEISGQVVRTERPVHPSLERFSAWISAVGAAIALHDLDGDGLANDFAHTDPRTDRVVVGCVPGTPSRYPDFALDPMPLIVDRATEAPMGCLPGDFNEDGLTDLLVYYWGRPPILFLRRSESVSTRWAMGASAYEPVEAVAGRERWFTNAATLADLDGDGHLDVYVGNYFPDGARILDASATGSESMQHSMSRAWNGGHDHILLGSGGGSKHGTGALFTEARGMLEENVSAGWTLAAGAADLDGDLLPEIYIGNDFGPDRLLLNRSKPGQLAFGLLRGRRGFTTPSSKILGHDSFKGMGVDFGDVNGDGRLDIYVSNISNEFALLESHFMFVSTGEDKAWAAGFAPFSDRSEPLGLSRSGWSWDCRLDDFDNDGSLEAVQATGFIQGERSRWPQLQELAMGNDDLVANPRVWPRFKAGDDLSGHQLNGFFVRGADGRFHDVASAVGLDERQVARGLATADVDGDGDLDIAIANQWAASSFYRNDAPAARGFLGLHLILPPGGTAATVPFTVAAGHPQPYVPRRYAVGAEVRVVLPDGSVRVAQVDGGNGHSGKRSPEVHFGLGKLPPDTPLAVTVRWRDDRGQLCSHALMLVPGWHTVTLGGAPALGAAR